MTAAVDRPDRRQAAPDGDVDRGLDAVRPGPAARSAARSASGRVARGASEGAATAPADPGQLLEIYEALDRMHAWRGWHWWPDADPFEVVVGCILVQNTAWANVERALANLRAVRALEPAAMAALTPEDLEALVRPSGQYRQKARKLNAFLALMNQRGGLEALLDEEPGRLRPRLLATWGIGEETADCIVVYAARRPAFAIDAYTRRLFGRLGLGPPPPAPYRQWQDWFTSALSDGSDAERRELWARYHALIVLHGKHLCRKTRPRCGECALADGCGFRNGDGDWPAASAPGRMAPQPRGGLEAERLA
jgi:endonuclease-3 related protein